MFCQSGLLTSQKFRNQIRRKHKQKILTQLRQKYSYETLQFQQHKLQQFQQLWFQYLSNPCSIIPKQTLLYFDQLDISRRKGMLDDIEKIVNQVLQCQRCVNVAFVAKIVQRFSISSLGFFGKILDFIQENMEKQCQNQIQGRCKEYYQSHNQQQLIRQRITHKRKSIFIGFDTLQCQKQYRNQEQLILTYIVIYLNNMKQKTQKISLSQVQIIKNYFNEYWNENIDTAPKSINFSLCAQLILKLLHFKSQIKQLSTLINGIISVLIQQDASPATFYLLKKVLSCCPQSVGLILMHRKFQMLLHQGLKRDLTVKPCMSVVHLLVDRSDLLSQSNTDNSGMPVYSIISFSSLMRSMHNALMATNNAKIQYHLLLGLFNIVILISHTPQPQQYLKNHDNKSQQSNSLYRTVQQMCIYLQTQINYLRIYEKVLNNYTCKQQNDDNIFALLDFCVIVLYSYMCYHGSAICKQNNNNSNNSSSNNNNSNNDVKARCQLFCDKLLNGKQLDIIQLSCEHVLNMDSQRNWIYARNLLQALQVCKINGIIIEGIQGKINKVVKVLEQQEWRVDPNEKEELIGLFEKLVDETQ